MLFLNFNAIGQNTTNVVDIDTITHIGLQEFYVDDLFVSSDIVQTPSDSVLEWNNNTTLWCKFENALLAGNLTISLDKISSIRVKVREYGTPMWRTIYEYDINSAKDFKIAENYYFLKGNNTVYEIAIVPVLDTTEYKYITNTVVSDYDGCFICTKAKAIHAYLNLQLDVQYNQTKNVVTTLSKSKPFVISNGLSKFATIAMQTSFFPLNKYENDYDLDGANQYRKEMIDMLQNNETFVLKDDKGNRWIVSMDGTITENSEGHEDNIVCSFSLTEIGDINSTTDLYLNNLSDVDVEGV